MNPRCMCDVERARRHSAPSASSRLMCSVGSPSTHHRRGSAPPSSAGRETRQHDDSDPATATLHERGHPQAARQRATQRIVDRRCGVTRVSGPPPGPVAGPGGPFNRGAAGPDRPPPRRELAPPRSAVRANSASTHGPGDLRPRRVQQARSRSRCRGVRARAARAPCGARSGRAAPRRMSIAVAQRTDQKRNLSLRPLPPLEDAMDFIG
jgi:hypothetical protein